ncbi:MAG: histidine phosphatase family protein [Cytophagia bacterium]|nr:histidine phosphatase family protein [Cytophagia bacterium]NBW36548.1 histidine phosphatase family protein [Cytophagia bacterium]
MKTLYVVRHAKSSWDNPLLDDFSRPLNDRGKRDVPNMAKRLKEKHLVLDLILTSTAVRTLTTAHGIAKVLGYDENRIKGLADLYHASPEKILEILNQVNDHCDVVMLVGHNPGLTDFVNALSPMAIDNVPTCGIAAFQLDIDTWKEMEMKEETLLFYDYPKK